MSQVSALHNFEAFQRYDGTGFEVRGKDKSVIELKHDDPNALEAMIRYLYTQKYFYFDGHHVGDWRFHLAVSEVADKYLLNELEKEAYDNFKVALATAPEPINAVLDVFSKFYNNDCRSNKIEKWMKEVEGRFFETLLTKDAYRTLLIAQPQKMLAYLNDYVSVRRDPGGMTMAECSICGKMIFVDDGDDTECMSCWLLHR